MTTASLSLSSPFRWDSRRHRWRGGARHVMHSVGRCGGGTHCVNNLGVNLRVYVPESRVYHYLELDLKPSDPKVCMPTLKVLPT